MSERKTKNCLTVKMDRYNASIPSTLSINTKSRHTHNISRIPGLNPDSDYIAQHQIKQFRIYRNRESENTDFVKLCRQGGRKDLLFHDEGPMRSANNIKTALVKTSESREANSRPEITIFRINRNDESESTDFVKLCRQGGRKDLLFHDDGPISSASSRPQSLSLQVNNNKYLLKSPQDELPFIDQLRDSRHIRKYRRDISPVDEKTKLYFSYNRINDSTTSRLATSPKIFRFGGRRHF